MADSPLYRVNCGGPFVSDPDGGLTWESDNSGNPSIYFVPPLSGDAQSFEVSDPIDLTDDSLPAYAIEEIFQTEKFNNFAGNLTYQFPVTAGDNYRVNLYTAELFFTAAGERVYDGVVDGVVVFADVDRYAIVDSAFKGYRYSIGVTATTNTLEFVARRNIQNPAINALEIARILTPGSSGVAIPIQQNPTAKTLDASNTAKSDGHFPIARGNTKRPTIDINQQSNHARIDQ